MYAELSALGEFGAPGGGRPDAGGLPKGLTEAERDDPADAPDDDLRGDGDRAEHDRLGHPQEQYLEHVTLALFEGLLSGGVYPGRGERT